MDETKRTLTHKDALYLVDVFEKHFATKDELNQLKEDLETKISHLPTKEEFYTKEDELVSELKALREEVQISNSRSSENRDRLEAIETKLGLAA